MKRDTAAVESLTAGHLRKIVDWAIAVKAAALVEEKLTNYQYEVLQQAIRGIDMKSLTERSHHHQSSLTRAIDALVKLNLVGRSKAGLKDRRQVAIIPTKGAMDCQTRVEAAITERLSELFLSLPKSRQSHAADAIKSIAGLIGSSKYEQFAYGKPTLPSF